MMDQHTETPTTAAKVYTAADLWLPATVEGLPQPGMAVTLSGSCVVIDRIHRVSDADLILSDVGLVSRSRVIIPLDDATNRHHAALWLATRLIPGVSIPWVAAWVDWAYDTHEWQIKAATGRLDDWTKPGDEDLCAALAKLDPDDDRRLPDGSRLVDALALLLMCRCAADLDLATGKPATAKEGKDD